jgi:hypothetical protein
MTTNNLLACIAPCGLACHTCAASAGGVMKEPAQQLLRYLEGFDLYAAKLSAFDPRLKKFGDFKEVLGMLGEASCEGCRDGVCKFPGCGIAPCAKELDHDFCYQCPEFPCDKADFEPLLKAKWLKANERMKEIGPEAYFEEAKGRSHYA